MSTILTRRDLLKGGAGAAVLSRASSQPARADREAGKVRVGMVGVGGRGTSLLKVLLTLDGVEINAIADITPGNLSHAQDLVQTKLGKRPEGYNPDGVQPRAARAFDVGQRIVADVHDLGRIHARQCEHLLEDAPVGLRDTGAARRDVAVEQVGEPAAREIGVAVADREQAVAAAQALERRKHVRVQRDAVARCEEHLQRMIGVCRVRTGGAELARERLAPQERQVVCVPRNLPPDGCTQRTHRLDAVARGDGRVDALQPREQLLLRGLDHRPHGPQGVVEVEAQDSQEFTVRQAAG